MYASSLTYEKRPSTVHLADEDEDTDALPFTKGMPSSSDSSSESEDEVTEPASERSRSEVLSPIERNVIHVR